MGESYVTTDNPKFYIKDEYGNMKEFGKFASADMFSFFIFKEI